MPKKVVPTNIKVVDTDKIPAELLDALDTLDEGMPVLPPLQTIVRHNPSTDTAKLPTELLDALDDTYIPPGSPQMDDEPPFDDTDTAKVIPLKK